MLQQCETAALLSRASIFSSLAGDDIRKLAELVKDREYAAGVNIINQGDFGDSIYFICRGKVDVFIRNREGAESILNTLGEGDFFGEMALLTGAPRSASVRAATDAGLMFLYKADFDALLQKHPHLSILFSRILAERLTATTALLAREVDKETYLKRLLCKEEEEHLAHLVGKTKQFQAVEKRIAELACADIPLLVAGPEGTATEDVARLIHFQSPRRGQPFLAVDLGGGDEWRIFRQRKASGAKDKADEEQLLEEYQISTLFGHEPGAVAGADSRRLGFLELADRGTLVLRNIKRLTPATRERLLYYLLEKKFYRLGEAAVSRADAMIIATLGHRQDAADLPALYHGRIPEIFWKNRIDVPALSQRRRDIPLIAEQYLESLSARAGKNIRTISPQAVNTLVRYSWPGNDRELQSVIERGVMVCEGETLLAEHIFLGLTPYTETGRPNLLRNDLIRRLFRSTPLRNWLQAGAVFFLLLVLALTTAGTQDPVRNLGSSLVWYLWWPVVLVSFLFLGRIYCSMCPIHGVTRVFRKFGSANRPDPRVFGKIGVTVAAFLGIGLFWAEEVWHVKEFPIRTAILLLTLVAGSVILNVFFRQEVWCRYVCPLGYISGVYTCLAPLELRANNNVCGSQCKSAPCFKGDGAREGCPMGLFPVSLASNQFCKLCGACLNNCPYHSIHLDLRWPGAEIWTNREPNLITSLTAPGLLGMIYPLLLRANGHHLAQAWLPFTLLFWGCTLATPALVAAASLASGRSFFRRSAAAFGFAYIPLAFSAHFVFQFPFFLTGLVWLGLPLDPSRAAWLPGLLRGAAIAGTVGTLWMIRKLSESQGRRPSLVHGGLAFLLGSLLILAL